jgi:hypothetical protein
VRPTGRRPPATLTIAESDTTANYGEHGRAFPGRGSNVGLAVATELVLLAQMDQAGDLLEGSLREVVARLRERLALDRPAETRPGTRRQAGASSALRKRSGRVRPDNHARYPPPLGLIPLTCSEIPGGPPAVTATALASNHHCAAPPGDTARDKPRHHDLALSKTAGHQLHHPFSAAQLLRQARTAAACELSAGCQ